MPFVLRVDDCGWRRLSAGATAIDTGLEYFFAWREAIGIAGYPVVYGFIPKAVQDADIALLNGKLGCLEEFAVHGDSHDRGQIVERGVMLRNQLRLSRYGYCRSYIPPFNTYDGETIKHWAAANRERWLDLGDECFFFGGFPDDKQSLDFGTEPKQLANGLIHLPAFQPLYDQAREIDKRLAQYIGVTDQPLVVTLHVTWDAEDFDALKRLGEKLVPHLVGLDYVKDWLASK